MRRKTRSLGSVLATLVAVAAAGCASTGQASDQPSVITEQPPDASGSGYGNLNAGSRFDVELDRRIRSDEAGRGDEWSAVVLRDVRDGDRVLLPQGAVVSGIVTRAGEVEVEGETRQVIALLPQTLTVDGEETPIRAEVVDAEAETTSDRLSTRNIAIVGGSAVAGAILGEILFDETAIGAIVGAAGGTVVAIATEDTVIELDQGSVLTLELEDPVRVAQRPDRPR